MSPQHDLAWTNRIQCLCSLKIVVQAPTVANERKRGKELLHRVPILHIKIAVLTREHASDGGVLRRMKN